MNGDALRDALRAVIVLAFLAALVTLLMHSAGCSSPAQRTLTAVEIAEVTLPYQYALDVCRENARLAKSWPVYEACEKAESRRVCNEHPQLKAAWKRCSEVLP